MSKRDQTKGEQMLGWSHSKPNERRRARRLQPGKTPVGGQAAVSGLMQRVLVALGTNAPVEESQSGP